MSESGILTLATFTGSTTLILLVAALRSGRRRDVAARLGACHDERMTASGTAWSASADPSVSRTAALLLPKDEKQRKRLGDRLIHAGLYRRNSMIVFLTVKAALVGVPIILGLASASTGLLTAAQGMFFGAIAGGFGAILPNFWLDARKARRQTEMRRALPDALDVIVVCVEGGLSLPAAIARVSSELKTAYRALATEMGICQREIQCGHSAGEAFKNMADRFDVAELRGLASVILQSERFGASVVKALRVHSESLRTSRKQLAETSAQKASVKLVFPTVLFIFPALFLVVMGPAVFDIMDMFRRMISSRH